jgi:prophage antirepressor-like protein
MENQMMIFKNPAFGEVRTIKGENNIPWFVGCNVAKALGYKNYRDALGKHVDEEDKGVAKYDTLGGSQNLVIINESGLYSLVLSSKLPQVKAFKRWVTSEVLPAIRKDGGYIATKADETPEAIMARALLIAKSTIDRLEQEKDVLTQQNRVLSAKAEHLDNVMLCSQCYTTTQIAKELDMSINELTAKLLEMRIIYRQSGQYMLYAPFARLGLARNKTVDVDMHGVMKVCRPYLVWTEKGRIFIHNLMKQHLSHVTIGSAAVLIQPSLFS